MKAHTGWRIGCFRNKTDNYERKDSSYLDIEVSTESAVNRDSASYINGDSAVAQ